MGENVMKTIKWIMHDKKKIKFNEDDKTYLLAENQTEENYKKFGIASGVDVEVGFLDENTVNFVKKVKGSGKKEEVKEESKKEVKEEKKEEPVKDEEMESFEATIKGISKDYDVLCFVDKNNDKGKIIWYQIPEEVRDDYKNRGIKAKVNVKATVTKEAKPSIVDLVIFEEKNPEPPVEEKERGVLESEYKSRSTNSSIEMQVAVKTAGLIISEMYSGVVTIGEGYEELKKRYQELIDIGLKKMGR